MKNKILICVLACAAPLGALGLGACGEAGSSEGDITVYSGRGGGLIGALIDRYEARYDTDVKVRFGDTAELASTILEEGDASPADVFFSQDAGALGALEKEGRLAELPASVLDEVPARYRSPEGRWVATSARARVVAFNRKRVRRDELPRSILGFTDERWKGRIGWAPTNGSFQAFVTALRKLEGDDTARDWLEGIVANDPQTFENNTAIRDAIASEEIDVGFINHYYVAEAQAAEGPDYPVDVYFPPGGDPGSLVNVAGIGMLASSEKRDQVLRFTRYMLSRTGQEYFAQRLKEYPVAAGVQADRRLVPLERIDQPRIDLSNLDDLRGTLELIEESGAL
jgi:iron(III) transport system substrate-binding protein